MNYKKLLQDIKDGKFDTKKHTLVFDNDGGYWDTNNENDDNVRDRENERLGKIYGYPGGYSDLVDLANAAGIPAEWC